MRKEQCRHLLYGFLVIVFGATNLGWAQMKATVFQQDASVFANPDQGFYVHRDLHALRPDVGGQRKQGVTLVWGRIDLKPYREQAELPKQFLTQLETGLAVARDQGMKVIVRASYGHQGPGGDYTTFQDPPEEIMRGHIRQLASVFTNNVDVIALFEAGFVGPWGEWHGTAIARDYDRGRDMLMFVLAHTPRDRMVVVRYPYLKQQIFARCDTGYMTVDAANAYSGLPVARVGHHNDCFLSSHDDVGTYNRGGATRDQETAYLAEETLYTVFGGETCQVHSLNDSSRAIQELTLLHGTYLNKGYHPGVLHKWQTQGCLDEIKRRLGARLQLMSSYVSSGVLPGEILHIEFTIANIGFASLYNARPVQIVLKHRGTGQRLTHTLGVDPRRWKPGESYHIHEALGLRGDVPPGAYDAYLFLPDAYPSLADDPRYAVRLANKDVWQAETGFNRLARGIQVGAGHAGR